MSKKYMPLFLIIYAAYFILIRSPILLVTSRFWAEEGQTYFSHAYNSSFINNLFSQFFGYYTLVPNIATSAATLVSLKYAPIVTTSIAMLIQLLVCSIVIFGNSMYWNSTKKKLFIIFAILVISQPETWAHTIHSMFWLSLGTFMIILEQPESADANIKLFYRFMVIISGLTGVVSCFMAPVYALKAYRTKFKEDCILASLLSICSLLQLCVFVSAYTSHNPLLEGRLSASKFDLLNTMFLHLVWPFIGNYLPETLSKSVHNINTVILTLFIVYFTYVFYINKHDESIRYTAYTFIIVSVLSTIFSISMASGDRYTLLTTFCLFIGIYHSTLNKTMGHYIRHTSSVLLSVTIILTSISYQNRMTRYTNPSWPKWENEVKLWEVNHSYKPRIWPEGKAWVVELRDK